MNKLHTLDIVMINLSISTGMTPDFAISYLLLFVLFFYKDICLYFWNS